jgi:glycine oxidase
MLNTPDITIIGGGIIGLLTAREFALAGASVVIIDKNQLGREASWAGGGILLPLYPWRQDQAITSLVLQSLKIYPALAEELIEVTGIDPELTRSGLLITHNPDIAAAVNWCQTNKITYATPEEAMLSPFHTDLLDPLWLPDITQARNPRLLKALKQYLQTKQVVFIENCAITNIELQQNRVQSIQTTSGQYAINQLIMAAGAWTGELWQTFFPAFTAAKPNIQPIKGQMLLFDCPPGTLQPMVLAKSEYLIPRRDGKILAGSTVEKNGFDKSTTTQAKEHLQSFALNLFPALKDCPLINHWAGLRPGTAHGIPYIDTHPEIVNLSINAGHFRNGLVMGPASAQLLVDLVTGRKTSVPPEAYATAAHH